MVHRQLSVPKQKRGMVYRTQLRKLTLLLGLLLLPLAGLAFSPVAAKHGMVVASEPLASEAGLEILRAGGNAVDAAVAVGFALAVTHPQAGNLGGGGFMLVRLAGGEAVVVDYREEAPAAATRDMFLDAQGKLIPEATTIGARAACVPGTVAGLALAHRTYGKLPWARVLRPAIRLAEQGFPVSYGFSESLREDREQLAKFSETRRIFLRDGRSYEPGEVFRQPDLARTLRQIAASGPKGFYQGRIARAIAATVEKHGGFSSVKISSIPGEDPPALARYLPRLRDPDRAAAQLGRHRIAGNAQRAGADGPWRAKFVSVDSLGGGGDAPRLCRSGRLPGRCGLRSRARPGPYQPAVCREAARGDPPGQSRRAGRAGKPAEFESAETTHFSVVDAQGNAVANTYTLNGGYGSGVTVEGAGFLLNNQMDDFAAKPGEPNMYGLVQGDANAIGPRKRPLSSMTPTIVVENGQVRLVLGSPGGGTIINTVLQVLLNVLAFKMDIRRAVMAPRFHHQWKPDELMLERWGFSADTIQKLQESGYRIAYRDRLGICEAIEIDPATGWRFGAADPRGDGKAVGY